MAHESFKAEEGQFITVSCCAEISSTKSYFERGAAQARLDLKQDNKHFGGFQKMELLQYSEYSTSGPGRQ